MILVTGGTGLLGSHLVLRLLQDGQKVRAIVREGGNPEKALQIWRYYIPDASARLNEVEWISTDICNKAKLAEAFDGVDHVYHCAAVVSFDPRKKAEMIDVNVKATRNIVDLSLERGIKKLVHVSTIAAIGNTGQKEEISEKDKWPVNARSIYAKTKTDAELEVWRGVYEGLNAVMVNPSIILGPGFWKESSARFYDVIYHGLKYYTSGCNGFVDVEDVTAAMIMLMNGKIKAERFILNGANLSFQNFFEKVANALKVKVPGRKATPLMTALAWRFEWLKSGITGKPPLITRSSAASSQTRRLYSASKIKEMTGITFRNIDDTITRIADLYLKDHITSH